MAHRDILVPRNNRVPFGSKRTSDDWQRRLAGSQMTQGGHWHALPKRKSRQLIRERNEQNLL